MTLILEGLRVAYGGARVVENVSFDVSAGEILSLLGRNGAGKTTTLKAIMGLVKPAGGSIRLDGEELVTLPPHRRSRLGIGYVPQGRRLFPLLTVGENLTMGLLAGGRRADTLDRVLALFPGLRERLAQRAGTLSGGQQQMAAMARALCMEPRLLLLDEPTEGLMPSVVNGLLEILRTLREQGVGVLLVEQKLEAALSVADRVVLMENGTIAHEAPPDALAAHPEVVERYLGVRQS